MERYAPLATLILMLAGCEAVPRPPAKAPSVPERFSGEPDVATELDIPTLHPREGDLATVTLRIRNATESTLILRDVSLVRGGSASMTWQQALPGRVEYVEGIDEWVHERGRPGTPRPIFNSGLLLPKEEIRAPLRIRLLEMPLEFRLTYFSLTREELTRKVYFQVRKDREMRYRKIIGSELDTFLRNPIEGRPAGGLRVVVFPHADEVVSTARTKSITVEASLTPRAFSFSAALQKAGIPKPSGPDPWTYSATLDGWIFRSPDAVVLATSAAVIPLPKVRHLERTFFHIDSLDGGKLQVEFLRETKTLFSEKYRLVGDASGTPRFYLFLSTPEILPFLKEVREAGLEVDVEVTPQTGGRLLITR